MHSSCAIALAGLLPIERALIEGALFQTPSGLIPGAVAETDPARADLIIANADNAAALKDLQALSPAGRVVLLGNSDQGTGWPVVPRPLRLQALVEVARRQLEQPARQLPPEDRLAPAARGGGWLHRIGRPKAGFSDTQPYAQDGVEEDGEFAQTRQFDPLSPPPALSRPPATPVAERPADGFAPTQHFSHSVPSVVPSDWEGEPGGSPSSTDPPSDPDAGASDVGGDTVPAPLPDADRVLVVGHPGSAPAGLMRVLEGAGYPVDFAGSPEAVSDHLARQAYQFVVLIEVSLGPQALHLCRDIQHNHGRSPDSLRLLIVASHNGWFARMRAWFAGCNAWLPIPLNQSRLLTYLDANRAERARA